MKRVADFLTFIGAVVIVSLIAAGVGGLLSLLPEPLATLLVIVALLGWAARLVQVLRQ